MPKVCKLQLRRTQIQTQSPEKVSHLLVFCYCFSSQIETFLATGFELYFSSEHTALSFDFDFQFLQSQEASFKLGFS